MRICVPTDDDHGLRGHAFEYFGRAPFFTLVDTDGAGVEILPNPDCHAHPDSCHHIPELKAHEVDAVVCDGIGRRAAAALENAGIEVRRLHGLTVEEIVEKVRRGETRPVTAETYGYRAGFGRRRRERWHGGDRGGGL